MKDLLGASVTVTVDAAGKDKLGDLQVDEQADAAELEQELEDVSLGIAVKDAQQTLAELRLVGGTLYARVGVAEIERLTDAEGSYDDAVADAPENAQPALADLGDGKWLTLPLEDYVDDLKDAAAAVPTPTASVDPEGLQDDLLTALKPHVSLTDANDDSDNRVLNLDVDARPAVKALLAVLQDHEELPFAGFLTEVTPADVDKGLAAGKAHATLTLSDGHLRQVALDVDSVRRLDPEAGTTDLSGSAVVLDLDDSADEVQAPTEDVSDVDVQQVVEDLFHDLFAGFQGQLPA